MYVDDPMILETIALLKAHEVRHIVIAPGSRHYPVVRSLEADEDFHLYSVVDERSAAFFAMGVIRAVNAPVAVLTTSGTAAVNLASAVADAYYQRLPLVAITTDRLPQLLDQMEDQMVDQVSIFKGMLRARAVLRPVQADIDHWYNNRVLNEALLAMRVNGTGPIHIDIPIGKHTGFTYKASQLPTARVISHHTPTAWGTDWAEVHQRLLGKKVMVLWGQSNPVDQRTYDALEYFTSRTDSLIVADHLGNLTHAAALAKAFLSLRSGKAREGALTPDIVVTVGGPLFLIEEAKSILREKEIEHWRVDPDGKIVDPFWQLTDVFQINPVDFFLNAIPEDAGRVKSSYRATASEISKAIPKVNERYGELSIIGAVMSRLPLGSALHIANSAPIRMAHLYDLDPSITVLGNRGVNGIDGSMSATIGYAAASVRLTFLIIGDLSFFYDMNSLGIRHRPKNLRILLVNNGGGALMHSPVPTGFDTQATKHTSAGHTDSAQGWVESLGVRYLSATDSPSFETGLPEFVDENADGPIVFEVFTEKISDIEQFRSFRVSNSNAGASAYRKIRRTAGTTLRRLGLRG